MAFMTTPLGRAVPLGEWKEYGVDQVLHILYDFARNPINDGTLVFSLTSICNATRLDIPAAIEVTTELIARGLAEQPTSGSYRITQQGIHVVNAALVGGRVEQW